MDPLVRQFTGPDPFHHCFLEIAMKKVKWIFLAILLVVSHAAVAAPAGEETVAINFSRNGNYNPYQLAFDATAEEFARLHPEIELNIDGHSLNDTYIPKLNAAFAANEVPDMMLLWAGKANEPYYSTGKILELDRYLSDDPEWRDSFYAPLFENLSHNGNIMGVPQAYYTFGIFVNKSLYEQHGIPLPQTWPELLAAVEQLYGNGVIPFSDTSGGGEILGWFWHLLAARTLGVDQHLANCREGNFDDPRYGQVTTLVEEFIAKQPFDKNFLGMSWDESSVLFIKRKAAMRLFGTWFFSDITALAGEGEEKESFIEQLGWISFPSVPGGKGSVNDYQSGLIASFSLGKHLEEDPAKLDAALTFLKFMTGLDAAKAFTEMASYTMAIKAPAGFYDPTKIYALQDDIAADFAKAEKLFEPPRSYMPAEMVAILKDEMTALYLGEKTAQQVWDRLIEASTETY
jgi:ABC-type glycerol-3-phosphate transport system substrate-binding protein